MAADRWSEPGEPARSPSEGAPAEDTVEALRAAHDARAREAAEAQDRYLRTLAEFENYRRRIAREREDWNRQAQERLLKEILPALDNFDRALAVPPTPGTDPAFRTGVELIHREFLNALDRVGVRPFVAVGQPFDPTRHEAVGRVERRDVPDQTVVSEALPGYLYQERVLRPAQVVVAVHAGTVPSGGESGEADLA
jgi:molecular chaperone GrpE